MASTCSFGSPDASIHSHLKMDGAWLVNGQIRRIPVHKVRILLETADSRAAGIDLGVLEILKREHDMEAVAHLGPDLLGDDWEPAVAAANLSADPDRGSGRDTARSAGDGRRRQRVRQRAMLRGGPVAHVTGV